MYLKLAWRNIWRNRTRTLITAAAVFFAVVLAVFMQSMQIGAYGKMIENVVGYYTGYVQVHQNGFWDEQILDNSFAFSDSLENQILAHENVDAVVPRVEGFALSSVGKISQPCRVVGIDPEKEDQLTNLQAKMDTGVYLTSTDQSVVIASGLADKLKVGLGDTLILLGQGYHGVNAAGLYPIKGVVRFGSPDLNKIMVYMPLEVAQQFYGAEEHLTSYALLLNDPEQAEQIAIDLSAQLGDEYEVMDWMTMLPELIQSIEGDYAGGLLMLGILYMIISFGIFSTLIMMTMERMHEFGILIAIGMKKLKLAWIVLLEIIMLTFLGVLSGSLGALPIVTYFNINPIYMGEEMEKAYEAFGIEAIIPTAIDPNVFLNQVIFVFSITLLLSLYPLVQIYLIKPVTAMNK